jgi:hypothetical protein
LGKIRKDIRKEFKGDLRRTQGEFKKGFLFVIYGIWSLDHGDCKAISKEMKRNFAMDLCSSNTNKTQTQNKLKSMSTLLQIVLHECKDC